MSIPLVEVEIWTGAKNSVFYWPRQIFKLWQPLSQEPQLGLSWNFQGRFRALGPSYNTSVFRNTLLDRKLWPKKPKKCLKMPINGKLQFLVCKIQTWHGDVMIFKRKVIQLIINKFAKFQYFSISIREAIKVLKIRKNALFSSITCHKKCLRQQLGVMWPWNFAQMSSDKF